MSNPYDRTADRILHHLEQAAPSPVDRFLLVRVTTTPNDPPGSAQRALQLLVLRGDVRQVGDRYKRVPGARRADGYGNSRSVSRRTTE